MSQKSEELYNSSLRVSVRTPDAFKRLGVSGSQAAADFKSLSQPFKTKDSSTRCKLPPHCPRRFVIPGPLFGGDHISDNNKFTITKSEVQNYKIICKLASSQYQRYVSSLSVHTLYYISSFGSLYVFTNFYVTFLYVASILLIFLEA